MWRTVFRVLTPNTQYGKSSDGQQDSPDSLFQDNPDTLYKICSSIAKVILFYESPRQVVERYIDYILRLTANSQSDSIEKLLNDLTYKHKFVIKNHQLNC